VGGTDISTEVEKIQIEKIIKIMIDIKYANTIILVINTQSLRISSSVIHLLQQLELLLSPSFYQHTVVCVTKWYMDDLSVSEREEEGISEESVTKYIQNFFTNPGNQLHCTINIPILFIDSFYQKRAPVSGDIPLRSLQSIVQHHSSFSFITNILTIKEIKNIHQEFHSSTPITPLIPILTETCHTSTHDPRKWSIEPTLPGGLELDRNTGIISGTPSTAQAYRRYQLYVENHHNKSAGYAFSLTISHSIKDMQHIISYSMSRLIREITTSLPLSLSLSSSENGISEIAAKKCIEKARIIGREALEEELSKLQERFGMIDSFPSLTALLTSTYELKLAEIEKDYLISNLAAIGKIRERERIISELQKFLLEEKGDTTILINLIIMAEKLDVDDKLIQSARCLLKKL